MHSGGLVSALYICAVVPMRKNSHIGISSLMIMSMIILTGFVSYWLIGQFKEQKKLLYTKMTHELLVSQDEVMDSVLVEYLDPLLKDSFNIEFRTTHSTKTRRDSTPNVTAIAVDYNYDSADSATFIGKTDSHIRVIGSNREKFLLRGVKMVMKYSTDSLTMIETKESGFFPAPDTQKVMLVFNDRIHDFTGKKFSTIWLPDTMGLSHAKKGNQLFLTLDHWQPNSIIKVDKIFPYVLGQILPQVLFAFFLLLLSGSAFYFTFRSLRRQMELNTIRNEFISNVSHELKTPVSTVKVALEALQNYNQIKNPEITREYLDMASKELDRLDLLTQKVLTHSKLESGHFISELVQTDLVLLCTEVIQKLSPRFDNLHAGIRCIHSHSPIHVKADPFYIEGVLINLIDNALKYGGEEPQIEIEMTQDEKEVRVSVSDNGSGIPRAYQSQIFDKFFRVPAHNKHNIKGHGLGLSFATLVMEQHGGSIRYRDRKGGGAVFELVFPTDRHES